ncbi:hypothetical protein OBBRIDRAFT_888560 [Obba rivulosa]|uniref:Uncharacterized protein n=1 Tax=Obba rivulosa TaxID=1052685 RepID=A0A8E2AW98_9APHY|nr:hypothetical protein OBBRIDRAFT_888560 [Obba rivulosa]
MEQKARGARRPDARPTCLLLPATLHAARSADSPAAHWHAPAHPQLAILGEFRAQAPSAWRMWIRTRSRSRRGISRAPGGTGQALCGTHELNRRLLRAGRQDWIAGATIEWSADRCAKLPPRCNRAAGADVAVARADEMVPKAGADAGRFYDLLCTHASGRSQKVRTAAGQPASARD